MRRGRAALVLLVALGLAPLFANAQRRSSESPRSGALRLKLGGYNPRASIDSEPGLTRRPYFETFEGRGMLLFELAYEYYLFQGAGAFGVGLSAGYAEKYGPATLASDVTQETSERTALQVFPLRLHALYNFDYPALHLDIPLVPYLRGGVAYVPWRVTKGAGVERVDGKRAVGGKWGVSGAAGLAFLLDVLEPRLAADFDADVGVNNSYLFAEYDVLRTDLLFGGGGLNLSSHQFMFGLNLEF
ncbi:MAG TPA: MXAN_2562 family outer membrane beta-barrel protein [Myxococcaceae bacterium]|nr:MXAN_2562 family outer membrane beta-barrel protein [Myxococcaceae bacterium]